MNGLLKQKQKLLDSRTMIPRCKKSRMLVLYSALEQVESRMERLSWIMFALRFYEFLMLVYLIIRNDIVSSYYNSNNLMNPNFMTVDHYINYTGVLEIALIICSVVAVLFFALLFLSQINSMDAKKQMIVCACTIIALVIRVLYLQVVNQILNTFLRTNEQYPILKTFRYVLILPILLFILYSACVNRRNHIYGVLHPVIFALPMLDLSNYLLFATLLLVFLYKNFYVSESEDIIFFNTIMVSVVYKVFQTYKENVEYIQIFFLLFFIVVGLSHLFWKSTRIAVLDQKKNSARKAVLSNKRMLLEEYYEFIKNKKEAVLRTEEQLLIQSIILDEYDRCPQNEIGRLAPFIQGNKVPQWSLHDHIKFLICEAEIYHSEQKTKQSHALLLFYRLEDTQLHYDSLLEISEQFCRQSAFTIHKYSLYKLIIKLETWFRKFKGEIASVEDAIRTDAMVVRFYSNIDSLFELFISIWRAIQKDVIDFSVIEPLYISAIEKYNSLESLLIQIKKRVKSSNEIYKFNQLSNLLQLKVLAKQQTTKFTQLDDNLKNQVPFLRICNKKVIYSSYKFNSRYYYNNEEILNLDVDQIMPSSFRENFITDDKDSGDGIHLKLKEFQSIICNGKGCLEFVKITPYIELDFLGQITYTVFFSPQNNSVSSYILYSLDTDIIEELSNGFLQLFGLQAKDGHNVVTGKEAFQEYDFSCPQHREKLAVQGNLVQTHISVFQFKSTIADRFDKIAVTLRLVHQFDLSGSIRLLLEVRPITSEYFRELVPSLGIFVDGLLPTNDINFLTTGHKLQSREYPIDEEDSQKMRFMADLVEKKQAFNRDKSRDNFTKNHWKCILRIILFVIAVAIITVLLFYGSRWYSYMQLQISRLNDKLFHLISVFESQFVLGILKNWPSPSLTSEQRESLIQNYYSLLTSANNQLYLEIINTMQYLDLPLVQFTGGVNRGSKIEGSSVDLLNIISSSYFIFTEQVVQYMLNVFPVMPLMIQEAPDIDGDFILLRKWMNACIVVASLTLVALIVLRAYQTFEDKFFEKVLQDIQMLFSFLNNEEVHACIAAIEKTNKDFNNTEENRMTKTKQKIVNELQTQLKTLNAIQSQPLVKKKTSKTSSSNLRSLIKTLLYVAVVSTFFIYLIVYTNEMKQSMPSIIKYENQIQLACRKTQINIVNAYYYMIQTKLGSNTTLQLNNLFVITLVKNDYLVPKQFENFYGEIWTIINSDLCYLAPPSDLEKCKDSILAKGLVYTLDMNLNNIKKMSQRGLDAIFTDGIYDQIMFLREYLLKQMNSILQMYDRQMDKYLQGRMYLYLMILICATLITVLSGVLIWIDCRDQVNRNSICKSLFNIFPEQFFLKPEIRAYVEETNLTHRLLNF